MAKFNVSNWQLKQIFVFVQLTIETFHCMLIIVSFIHLISR